MRRAAGPIRRPGQAAATTRCSPSRRRTGAGLTLIEVVISLVILATGLLVLLQGFSAGAKVQRVASIDTLGILKAEEVFGRLVQNGSVTPTNGEGTEESPAGFRWSIQVSPADDALPEGPLQRVLFTAFWDGVGGERSITLASFVGRDDAR